MKKNTLIMFDCFGVISSCVLPTYFRSRFGETEGYKLERFYCEKGDMGELTLMDIAVEASKLTGEDPKTLYRDWIEGTVVDPRIRELVLKLKEEYHVVLASNAMEDLVEKVFQKHDLYGLFDKIFISYKMKDVKPNISYYQTIINSYDIKFDKIIMIDDRTISLIYVKEIGIEPILFTTFEEVKNRIYEILDK